MVKADIVEKVVEATRLSKSKARQIVDAILDEMFNALAKGENVIIRKFGTFEVVRSNRLKGRNLKTGEEVRIDPRMVVRFRPSKKLKKVIEE